MPTDLSKLKVSLTKHGAHKIAFLLQKFDKDDILNHLDEDSMDIHINEAQTRRILSIEEGKKAPDLWNEIKKYGLEDIFDLVFVAIIFSHHELISAFKKGITDDCTVRRGAIIDGWIFRSMLTPGNGKKLVVFSHFPPVISADTDPL